MMISVLALLAAQATALGDARAYFPLNEGDEYQYEETIGKQKHAVVMKTAAPKTVDSYSFTPVLADTGRGEPEAINYIVDAGAVKIIQTATRQKKKNGLPEVDQDGNPVMETKVISYPVFKVTDKFTEWAYSGQTVLLSDFTSLELAASSKYLGVKDVMGSKREVIEVVLNLTVGATDGPAIRETNTSYYAKGLGMYLSKSVQVFGRKKAERQMRLVAYNPKVGA